MMHSDRAIRKLDINIAMRLQYGHGSRSLSAASR
jgi:hypothetical protein